MDFSNYQVKLISAIEAALLAGEEIKKVYNNDFNVELKDDNTPLTLADKLSHNAIEKHLSITSIPILSEEGKLIPYEERKNWNELWIVDPLDGTKEFIKRNGEFTINIALVNNHVPVLSVLFAPIIGELYFSVKNFGAYFCAITNEDFSSASVFLNARKLACSNSKNKSPIKVVASRSHMSVETIEFIEDLKKSGKEVELVSRGSALKFGLLAKNEADIYPRMAPTMEWDTAAGQLLIEETGKKLIDQITKVPMKYNRENLRNNSFVVE